jgi:hypothetical protein
MRWAGLVAHVGRGERNVYKGLVAKPEGNRQLGRRRSRWENGIRTDLREIGWGGVEWIQMAQDKGRWRVLTKALMNLRVLEPRILFVCWPVTNLAMKE